jgi:hypothetical protein
MALPGIARFTAQRGVRVGTVVAPMQFSPSLAIDDGCLVGYDGASVLQPRSLLVSSEERRGFRAWRLLTRRAPSRRHYRLKLECANQSPFADVLRYPEGCINHAGC